MLLSVDALVLRDAMRGTFSVDTAAVARVLRSHLKKLPTRILVFGCGNGRAAAQLAVSLDADVTGIDRQARFDARAQAYAALQACDPVALRFGDGAFDFVYSDQRFESLTALRAALYEMRRVLKRGGGFCLKLPAFAGLDASALRSELIAAFGEAQDVTQSYCSERHRDSTRLSRALWSSSLGSALLSSRYFMGRRTDAR
jgi:ubiquinone/menaquinone biosynthesis C-methylase UbiE